MEEVRIRHLDSCRLLVNAVGHGDEEADVRPQFQLGRHAFWRLHRLEQVAIHLVRDGLQVTFIVLQRQMILIVRRAATYLWRNVGHHHVIHFGNHHHEGHGQCRASDVHG